MNKWKKIASGILASALLFTTVAAGITPQVVKAEDTGYDTGVPEIQNVTAELINLDADGNATTASSLKVSITATDDVGVDIINFDVAITSEEKLGSRCYVYSQKYITDAVEGNAGWTVDGNTYSTEVSLADYDYDGYVFVTDVYVCDEAYNKAKANENTFSLGSEYAYRLLGTEEVVFDDSADNEATLPIESVGVYDTDGNAYATGTVITPGTTVVYRITTGDGVSADEINAWLYADCSNVSEYESLTLTRQEGTNTFAGEYTFTEDNYPTAWAIESFGYYDESSNTAYNAYEWNDDFPPVAEVILKNGNTVVYPTVNVYTSVYGYDMSNGYLDYISYAEINSQNVAKWSKLTDVITLPQAPSIIDGVNSDWYVYYWKWDKETQSSECVCAGKASDYVFDDDITIQVLARPEGYVPVEITYPAEEDNVFYTEYAAEWLKEDLSQEEKVSYMKEKYASGCTDKLGNISFYAYDNGATYISYSAEKVAVQFFDYYVNKIAGNLVTDGDVVASGIYDVDNLPTTAEIMAQLTNLAAPNADITEAAFQGWEISEEDIAAVLSGIDGGGIESYTVVWAQYDKDVAIADFQDKDLNWIAESVAFYPAGTSDDVIIAAFKEKSPDGYTNWTLDISGEDSFGRYYVFVSDGAKDTTTATTSSGVNVTYTAEDAKTEITKKDGKITVSSTVSFNTDSTTTSNGVTKLDASAVTTVANLITDTAAEAGKQAANGTVETPTVKVNMADATVIPTDILNAAKGQNVNVEFVMTGDDGVEYSWTINGTSISDYNLQDVNLKVNKGTGNVPSAVVSAVAGDSATVQLNLADHGLFGFTADLHIYVGTEYVGKYANLYYYTNGRLELQTSKKVEADGYATFSFTHASDYVIVIGEDKSSENTAASNVPTANTDVKKSPDTGDFNNAGLFMIIMIGGFAAIAGAVFYRRKRA
jgi:LPXTG-motif cell wall-anchored protein